MCSQRRAFEVSPVEGDQPRRGTRATAPTSAGLFTTTTPARADYVEGSAHIEAINHLTRGLALLKTLADTPERVAEELTLQVTPGVPLGITRGLCVYLDLATALSAGPFMMT